jgi:hypothetical protein
MRVNLTFDLREDVTPELFALKVATAVAKRHCLREGESVLVTDNPDPTLCSKFTYVGDYETTFGGALRNPVVEPNIESSFQ